MTSPGVNAFEAGSSQDASFPAGLRLSVDHHLRSLREGLTLSGGDPPRIIRLSPAGRRAVQRFAATGAADVTAERTLARRLTDAGLMHPQPTAETTQTDQVTVVVPVLDRAPQLERCLQNLVNNGSDRRVVVVDDGSRDGAAIATICNRFGARLVTLDETSGPAAARNAGASAVTTPFIAFLDSDCIPQPDWIGQLIGHFSDPLVAAVAPRIVGLTEAGQGAIGRFAAAHISLDMGAHPARVAPGGRVPYVPTAALLARRAALGMGFEPDLRYGEDVDLVWRLHDAGWRVRYDPSVVVQHAEPTSWPGLMARKFRYGTSAAELARRHRGRLAPLIVSPWCGGVVAAGLAGEPLAALAILTAQTAWARKRLASTGLPLTETARWPVRGAAYTFLAVGHASTTLAPLALLGGVASRRSRRVSFALMTVPPAVQWARRRPPLDVARWTALSVADNAAYGAGVWAGSIRSRSLGALLPVLANR